jgi:hypothetical protein
LLKLCIFGKALAVTKISIFSKHFKSKGILFINYYFPSELIINMNDAKILLFLFSKNPPAKSASATCCRAATAVRSTSLFKGVYSLYGIADAAAQQYKYIK